MPLPTHARFVATVLASDLSSEVVLLDTQKEHYYSLPDVGRRFWELLTEEASVDRAVACLVAEYDVDEQTLRGDLEVLWQDLAARGLVEEVGVDG